MTSRLYTAAFSSSDEDSDNDAQERVNVQRFIRPVQSDSEDEKRVVRSAKDKRHDELQNILRNLNNHKKIKDMSKVEIDFDELVRVYEKAKKMNEVDQYPKFYIRVLGQMEDFINESWTDKKSLSKTAARSLTNLKQRIRKYNKDFEEQILKYRENPELYEDDVEEEQEHEDDSKDEASSEDDKKPVAKPAPKPSAPKDSESEFSDDDLGSSDESDWSDSGPDLDVDDPSVFFLKDVNEPKKHADAKKGAKAPKTVKSATKTGIEESDDEGDWQLVAHGGEQEFQVFEKGVEITQDLVIKKVAEIISNRGKRTSSITEQISLLDQVCQKIDELNLGVGIQVKAILSLVTVLFDYESKHPAFMPVPKFQKAMDQFKRLFEICEANVEDLEISDNITDETESILEAPYRIRGSLISSVCRMDDEYYRILQNSNGQEMEYDERLRDEPKVGSLIDMLIQHLTVFKAPSDAFCVAYLRKVEHLYYKFDFDWAKRVETEGMEAAGHSVNHETMERLCLYIYKNDTTDRLRTRAILCHIYFLALFDNGHKARNLMLMSDLQASIDHADPSTMILYNRAMVQMGLCSFRLGQIREAHTTLSDLTGSSRIRELLAQGLYMQQRYERTPEEEKREKALQMPYHMHINTELIETVYLISAMLQEMSVLAASQEVDTRVRVLSKAFMTALRIHDRATLIGAPETPKDHVIAAAKAMRMGNWRNCINFIINPKMEAKIWSLFCNASNVKAMLVGKIKEECLRCYLFSFAYVHESISLSRLADHFHLPKSQVYSIISKMIINQELAGSLEVPADFLTMHKGERSRLQNLAIQLSDKVNSIVEMNEKLIENRGGLISGPKGMQSYQGPRRQRFIQAPKFI